MRYTRVLYAASTIIMIRSIVRVIEYIRGNSGYLLRNEALLYVFDGCLMLAVLVLYNVIHPSTLTAFHKGGIFAEKDCMDLGAK